MSDCCEAEGWPGCWVADVCLLEQAIAAGDMGAARAAAGHGQAEGSADALGGPQASAEEAAAVVPSISVNLDKLCFKNYTNTNTKWHTNSLSSSAQFVFAFQVDTLWKEIYLMYT